MSLIYTLKAVSSDKLTGCHPLLRLPNTLLKLYAKRDSRLVAYRDVLQRFVFKKICVRKTLSNLLLNITTF